MEPLPTYQYQHLVGLDAIRLIQSQVCSASGKLVFKMIHTTLSNFKSTAAKPSKKTVNNVRVPSPLQPDQLRFEKVRKILSQFKNPPRITKYTAISYVWGDANDTIDVIVDNQYLTITKNLYLALRRFPEQRLIWADAICINQEDDLEKAQQVQQMATIYKTASSTVIYLGEPKSIIQMDYIKWRRSTRVMEEHWDRTIHKSALPQLMKLVWFTRVWVFQELMFANEAFVLWGDYSMPWDCILYQVLMLSCGNSNKDPSWRQALDMDRLRAGFVRNDYTCPGGRQEFVDFFVSTLLKRQGLGVQDPRDMIFAHIGLLGDISQDKVLKGILAVSYTISSKKLYEQVVGYLLEHSQDLNLLAFTDIRQMQQYGRVEGLATWCLDLTSPPSHFMRLGVQASIEYLGWGMKTPRLQHSSFLVAPSIFVCLGLKIGSIAAMSQRLLLKSSPTSLGIKNKDPVLINTSKIDDVFLILESYFGIRFECNKCTNSSMEATPQCEFSAKSWRRLRSAEQHSNGFWEGLQHEFKCQFWDFQSELPRFLHARRFAKLDDGSIALVSQHARLGDIACHVEGSICPLLLRSISPSLEATKRVEKSYLERLQRSDLSETDPERHQRKLRDGLCIGHYDFVGECIVENHMPIKEEILEVLDLFALH